MYMRKYSKPEVSIVMAVYNGLPHLKKAIKSIQHQSFKNFEFIIVDDGSSDDSLAYISKIKDKRLVIIKNKKNLGLADSLNIGIAKAKGKYIARMDADDISLPVRLETQIKFLKANPKIDLCGSWARLINQNEKIVGAKRFPTEDSQIKKQLICRSSIIHPSMFAKSGFFKNNKYKVDFDYAEDYELLMRTKNKYQMANIPQYLLFFRVWDNRRSRKFMNLMDKKDLAVKIEEVKRNGVNLNLLFQIFKKIVSTYLLPYNLKIKLAQILKAA